MRNKPDIDAAETAELAWNPKEFQERLKIDMKAEGFKSEYALARKAEMDRSLFSRYREGRQPTPDAAIKIARTLNRAPVEYLLLAGHLREDELGSTPAPLPLVYKELLDLDGQLGERDPAEQERLRAHVGFVNTGAADRLARIDAAPSSTGWQSRASMG